MGTQEEREKETDQMVLERQFSILLQIQHDIAKAARDKQEAEQEQNSDDDGSPSLSRASSSSPGGAAGVTSAINNNVTMVTPEEEEYVYDPDDFNTDRVCSICLEDLNTNNNPVQALLCYHVYHVTCINSWRLKGSQECPLCG